MTGFDKKAFGSRLKDCRKKSGLNQTRLCKLIGISQPNLSAYEKGRFTPSVEVLIRISDALGVSVDYLLGRDDG